MVFGDFLEHFSHGTHIRLICLRMMREGAGRGSQRKWLRASIVLEDVAGAVRKTRLTSRNFVDKIYRQDDAGKFGAPDRSGKTWVRARLAFGAQLLSDLWHTAWMRSAEEIE